MSTLTDLGSAYLKARRLKLETLGDQLLFYA